MIRSMPSRFVPLSPATVRRYAPIARARGVSERARSASGFTTAYLRAGSMRRIGTDRQGTPWRARRDAFLRRHVAQMIARRERFYDKNGNPTRRHLALIMWAWSPDPSGLRRETAIRS